MDSVVGLLQGGSVVMLIVVLMLTAERRYGHGHVAKDESIEPDLKELIEEDERIRESA